MFLKETRLPEWCMNLNLVYQTKFDCACPFKYYKYINLSIDIQEFMNNSG